MKIIQAKATGVCFLS